MNMNLVKISFDLCTVGKVKDDNNILDEILSMILNHPSIDNIKIKKIKVDIDSENT
jgi:Holliday junction resolvase RusA-like endonuclease